MSDELFRAEQIKTGVHPNLIPVHCRNQDDMCRLAEQMRSICLKDTDKIEAYEGSATEPEALERAAKIKDNIIESGHLRFIHYVPDGRLTNVCFTLMERSDGVKQWNLSISHAKLSGPQRVDDDLALMIVGAYLDDGYEEVEPKAVWKAVRHFVKDMT